MIDKEFKTLDEQLEILKSRGLKINDESFAKNFLYRNNYYRVSGYSLTLRDHDVFHDSAEFQNIVDIYEFDHKLRHVLLEYIEIIEVTVKSVWCHEFARLYGPTGYLKESNFTDSDKYKKVIRKAEDLKVIRTPNEAFLKHFEELHQEVPIWAYVDILTLSDISYLYEISSLDVRNIVANILEFKGKSRATLLASALHKMTIIRNLCAHGSRLYNRFFEQRPKLRKADIKLLADGDNGEKDNSHLYGFIILMRQLLKTEDFAGLKDSIHYLTEKYPFVRMSYYGFREDWREVL